ncbi:MAG: co-chaperone GroES family protein [Acidobacteriota bacterium]
MKETNVKVGDQSLLVVGDRILVRPEDGESTTNTGLILPASVADRDEVQSGRVVAVGPGHPVSNGRLVDEESRPEPRYVAMQAKVGDLAVFNRKAAVEIGVSGQKLVVVPHGAVLVLLRDERARAAAAAGPVT